MQKHFFVLICLATMLFSQACSKTWQTTNAPSEDIVGINIFKKGEFLNADEQLALEINQKEATEFDLSVQQSAPVIRNKDPLVIQITKNQTLQLSSPYNGVVFDIFGDNFAGGKFKVSWPIESDFGFLVLPDQSNRVLGIQHMFGDGTVGPDGLAAANGFEALSKFDGLQSNGGYSLSQRNQKIDQKDEVFSKLRIWIDKNRNGSSESFELFTLESLGVVSISLEYDNRFYERDEFGNIIALKSTVLQKDGSSRRMFNLWLRYIDL